MMHAYSLQVHKFAYSFVVAGKLIGEQHGVKRQQKKNYVQIVFKGFRTNYRHSATDYDFVWILI